ncbi:UDP-N-acetylmuramate--L-alanine ligase [Acidiferrimicrobium sp. IK]|uniref:UDP-N-acetylmuramate--L-alanine ligase n=1 Tax=Acidiferrimicrobium sp. IK TaxID=2871700 RepID=UPI0021CB60D7|nr:UDP-N-acetylmuramate--L-alanine ligase [Acidiferrimicrobium sp. IK]MCU4183685.1 UDP-N-acetylmuramate--L-alanine ligase [Acidiferrimicrobium sp. IK]
MANQPSPPPPGAGLGGPPALDQPRRIHVVGAGGAGMSGIATVLASMGHTVTGSDLRDSPVLERLAGAGIRTVAGHDPALVTGADMVTASTAVPADDPEVAEARRLGIPVLSRAAILAAICRQRRVIAVAGTHGKTTTSSMLAVLLDHAGEDPSYVIGGDIAGLGPGARWGSGQWMVVEADESDGTFLQLGAEVAVVTSIEPDHLEHFGSLDALRLAFEGFLAATPGAKIVSADDPAAAAVGRAAGGPPAGVVTFGTDPGAGWHIADTRPGRGSFRFQATHEATAVEVDLQVPGLHNARNAAAALAAAVAVGVAPAAAAAGLGAFRGVGRRFERRGERGGVTYIDDYGHLPGEVRAALGAARDGDWSRVVAVFQPHRYSRTEALWASFADAFGDADVVVITDIYPSGEAPRPGVSGELVADAVRGAHAGPVHYVPRLEDLPASLEAILLPGDLCLTLGAGDLTLAVDRLVAGERPR